MAHKKKIAPKVFVAEQEPHCCADSSAYLTATIHNGGGEGDEYLAITLEGSWAFDDAREIDEFADMLKACLPPTGGEGEE